MPDKQHITLEAKAVATDRGEFTALAAAYSVDRVNDQIIPGAFAKTIQHWAQSGKQVPLHYNHEADAESIIGSVDPSSMRETDEGLEVSGRLDLENSAKAKEAWRAMRLDAMSLSFGYVVTEQTKGKNGVNQLREIDLFEISVVPGPANADTRFLSLKAHPDATPETVGDMLLRNLNLHAQQIKELQKQVGLNETDEAAAPEEPPVEAVSEQTPEVSHQTADPEAVRIELECIDALI